LFSEVRTISIKQLGKLHAHAASGEMLDTLLGALKNDEDR
jgi:hypothetical protein